MPYRLLLPKDYVSELINSINHATKRVNLVSLVILEDDATRGIIDALEAAAKRGVEVSVGMDLYFTYKELGAASRRRHYIHEKVRRMRATRNRLQNAGAKVRWLSQFGISLFSRRTHIKWSIVDNTVYCFGGVNLYDLGIDNNDYMFRVDDTKLADRMAREHRRLIASDRRGRSYRSHTFGDTSHRVLVDGGQIGDSVIYRKACSHARRAKHIIFVSQYCPSGKLSRLIKNVDHEIYFNRWQNADDMANRWLIRFNSWIQSVKTLYQRDQYLHAKFMIFTMADGSEVAITGSHNFIGSGGLMGTREIALETTDPKIIAALHKFLDRHIKPAK